PTPEASNPGRRWSTTTGPRTRRILAPRQGCQAWQAVPPNLPHHAEILLRHAGISDQPRLRFPGIPLAPDPSPQAPHHLAHVLLGLVGPLHRVAPRFKPVVPREHRPQLETALVPLAVFAEAQIHQPHALLVLAGEAPVLG